MKQKKHKLIVVKFTVNDSKKTLYQAYDSIEEAEGHLKILGEYRVCKTSYEIVKITFDKVEAKTSAYNNINRLCSIQWDLMNLFNGHYEILRVGALL